MLKALSIQNFQSHAKTELNFSEGVNIIVGPTDSGKSAIIRALRWLVWNRPSGDAIRSTWGGKTEVECETTEGSITRIKDKSEEYKLHSEGTDLDFKAFGTSVPEEISHVLNINEINLQQQLDSPFLLSDSPGEVAQHFNRVAHLDQIDFGLKRVQSWIRSIEQTIQSNAQQLGRLNEELTKYEPLDKIETQVEVLEQLHTQMVTQNSSKINLQSLISQISSTTESIQRQSRLLPLENTLTVITGNIALRNEKLSLIDSLYSLMTKINQTEFDITEYKTLISAEKLVKGLMSLFEKKKMTECTLSQLKSLISQITLTEQSIMVAEQKYEASQKTYNDNFPDVCPLCGKPK